MTIAEKIFDTLQKRFLEFYSAPYLQNAEFIFLGDLNWEMDWKREFDEEMYGNQSTKFWLRDNTNFNLSQITRSLRELMKKDKLTKYSCNNRVKNQSEYGQQYMYLIKNTSVLLKQARKNFDLINIKEFAKKYWDSRIEDYHEFDEDEEE